MSLHPFEKLTPDFILTAIETADLVCDGRLFALNSYENRVYQIGLEEAEPLIAKFYRPERWSALQILEEHQFTKTFVEHELSVVAPWQNVTGDTLFFYEGFHFALFPQKGGHAPELDNPDHLEILGRALGRMHAIGATKDFEHRIKLNIDQMGTQSVELIAKDFIPADLKISYLSLTNDLLKHIEQQRIRLESFTYLRIHGDCHPGNILWRNNTPHFVDFDDAIMAPAIQDIWMLLSGEQQQQRDQLQCILAGYEDFHEFNYGELSQIEVLRTLRMLNYSAWIARRWDDPAFPHSFPWFNTSRYWSDHILQLREQLGALQAPALTVGN
ncbi:MAG: serine/threonine protein kinase [Pseudomonadota bacterium]